MLLKKLVLFGFLSAAASAFAIPEDAEDGVYAHHVDVKGRDVHVKVAEPADYSGLRPRDDAQQAANTRPVANETCPLPFGVTCGPNKNMTREVSFFPPNNSIAQLS